MSEKNNNNEIYSKRNPPYDIEMYLDSIKLLCQTDLLLDMVVMVRSLPNVNRLNEEML